MFKSKVAGWSNPRIITSSELNRSTSIFKERTRGSIKIAVKKKRIIFFIRKLNGFNI
jgi:hypothetical protein